MSLSRSSSPTPSHKKVHQATRSTTPTSPMYVKRFTGRKEKETGESSQRSSMTQEDSLSYQLLSAHISPCSSPAIRQSDAHLTTDLSFDILL